MLFLIGAAVWLRPVSASAAAGEELVRAALSRDASRDEPARRATAEKLARTGDLSLVPAMVDALFFLHEGEREPLVAALRRLTGEEPGPRYYDWVELVGRRADIHPGPGYASFKASLFGRIDPRYRTLLADGPAQVRREEIVWGGVKLDGIPSLDDPPHMAAAAEHDLDPRERVFGLSAGGEHRAYPLRYLSWHEMVNDTLGGEAVTLSYCSLCGTGVAWSGRAPGGGRRTFGTSGLLVRSNKLMFDRESGSLWLQMTGEPVLGPAAAQPVPLTMLAATLTSWAEWRQQHPDTTVLHLDEAFGARWGYRYRPGSADQARAGVAFPVWLKSRLFPAQEEVYGLALGRAAKAWPIAKLVASRVVNDRLGDADLVLLADPGSRAVRAFRRDGRTFRSGAAVSQVLDQEDQAWRITEEALLPPDGSGLAPLPRLPGQAVFWFAWFGFHPQTETAPP
jgi:uncharacterized protein DUF3179